MPQNKDVRDGNQDRIEGLDDLVQSHVDVQEAEIVEGDVHPGEKAKQGKRPHHLHRVEPLASLTIAFCDARAK